MDERKCRILVVKSEGKMCIGSDTCNETRVLLQILDKSCLTMCTGFIRLKICISGGFCGHEVAQLVEALCYKPEGRRLDSQWCH